MKKNFLLCKPVITFSLKEIKVGLIVQRLFFALFICTYYLSCRIRMDFCYNILFLHLVNKFSNKRMNFEMI
jgi:hypothetical protein